jgi:hypothetical protein
MSGRSRTLSRRRGCLKWLGLALGLVAALLLVLVGLLWSRGSRAQAELRAEYPPRGEMVDAGGYRLQIYCLGSGSPTVLLDAGLGQAHPLPGLRREEAPTP